jgi:hypothetical protein
MSTATATPKARRRDWRGPRERITARVSADVAQRLRREAEAAGLPVSEHLAGLIDSTAREERTPT